MPLVSTLELRHSDFIRVFELRCQPFPHPCPIPSPHYNPRPDLADRRSMALIVQKFGGTSVADAERIHRAARRAIATRKAGNHGVVVVSARGNATDDLIELAKKVCENPPKREMDQLLATGEQVTIALMAMAIHAQGCQAISFTGGQIGLVTDNAFSKARIQSINKQRILEQLSAGENLTTSALPR